MLGLISRERENKNINDTRKTENIPLDKARNDCIPNCRVAEMVSVKWQDVTPVIIGTTCHVGNRKMYQKRKHGIAHHVDWTKKPKHIASLSALNLRDGLRIFPY